MEPRLIKVCDKMQKAHDINYKLIPDFIHLLRVCIICKQVRYLLNQFREKNDDTGEKTDNQHVDDFLVKLSQETSARRLMGQINSWRKIYREGT